MTQLDVTYRYGVPPAESATLALAKVREVYGVRQMQMDEANKTVRVEYDASRLTEPVIHQLLRRAGPGHRRDDCNVRLSTAAAGARRRDLVAAHSILRYF